MAPLSSLALLFELIGHKMVKLFPGRRMDYEPKLCEKQRSEQDFMTAVEFSSDYPYGSAAALVDFRSGTFKAKDDWMVLPGITLMFILSDILKKKGYSAFTARANTKDSIDQINTLDGNTENITKAKVEMVNRDGESPVQGISQSGGGGNAVKNGACGGCGAGCGGSCANEVETGACGGCSTGCGGGCGMKSGGCGGCVGGCGDNLQYGNGVSANNILKLEFSIGSQPVAA